MSPALAVSRRGLLKGAAAFAAASALPLRAQTVHNIMYVGCYTARGRGVYVFQQDPSTGKLTELSVATDVQPSFVALDPQARFLYACNEIANYAGGVTGSVTSFAVDANTGNLTLLNKQSSEGRNPAHVSVEPTGKFALAANYSGGSVTVLPILEDGRLGPPTHNVLHTGRLGPNTGRQEAPHAHQILSDPFGRYVLANDLALDQTIVYFLDRNSGTLIPNSVATAAPGAGPRHLAFFPDGRFVFVLNELDNTVSSFAYDADRGILTRIQTISTLPTGWIGRNTTAQVVVSADGRFLYASNRNFNSIALFTINAATGELAIVDQEFTQGETPRNFNLDPAGNFLYVANMNSDNIVVYRVDSNTGKLTPTGDVYAAGQPSSIVFNPPPASGNSARAGVTFWANPNPIYAGAGGLGQTTLSWNAPGTRLVEIHIGSPNGPNVGSQPAYGTTTTFRWVNNGMTFYLQDVSDGKALIAENTLATVRAVVR